MNLTWLWRKKCEVYHSLEPFKEGSTYHQQKFGGSVLLSSLFNAILLYGHISAPFKHGLIILIPKGHNKHLSLPLTIEVQLCISVFEKVLLHVLCLTDQQAQLNPLQGSFRPGFSCLHPAFIFKRQFPQSGNRRKKGSWLF